MGNRALICGLVLLAGCEGATYPGVEVGEGEDERPFPVEEVRGVHPVDAPERCVILADDVDVETEATADGVAMVFTTAGDVEELRQRVRQLADRYDALSGRPMMWEVMAPVEMSPSPDATVQDEMPTATARRGVRPDEARRLPEADVRYEDHPRGARLLFTAEDAAERELLEQEIREHPRHMAQGMCMMEHAAPPPQVLPDED